MSLSSRESFLKWMLRKFKMLTSNEIMEINGGIALTTAILVTLFCAGFAGGIAVGLNRKNRK